MKTLIGVIGIAVLAWPGFAAPMTQGERERALSEFQASRKQFLDAINGLSAAQWNFKPDEKTWSVAECAEHIAISEDVLYGLVTKALAAPAEPGQKSDVSDEILLKGIPDRSRKFQAPEVLQPKHENAGLPALTERFKTSRERTLDYIRSSQDDLRGHFFKHPAFGNLDAYQWLLLVSAHCQRHTAQIAEVKANANFPK